MVKMDGELREKDMREKKEVVLLGLKNCKEVWKKKI